MLMSETKIELYIQLFLVRCVGLHMSFDLENQSIFPINAVQNFATWSTFLPLRYIEIGSFYALKKNLEKQMVFFIVCSCPMKLYCVYPVS